MKEFDYLLKRFLFFLRSRAIISATKLHTADLICGTSALCDLNNYAGMYIRVKIFAGKFSMLQSGEINILRKAKRIDLIEMTRSCNFRFGLRLFFVFVNCIVQY